MYPVSFGGQRSIQLSYGRLWASIDQTPASGNGIEIAGCCSIGCWGKLLRQRSDVRIVSGAPVDRVPRACRGLRANHAVGWKKFSECASD